MSDDPRIPDQPVHRVVRDSVAAAVNRAETWTMRQAVSRAVTGAVYEATHGEVGRES